jgi:putative FmdB family regulatory protein
MPLYEYVCAKCGHRFEMIRKFSDAPLEECPKCGGRVEKQQSAPAIQFKGTGWYITDYAKKDSVPAESSTRSEEKADARSDAKAHGKSESKSESTSESTSSAKTESRSDSTPAAKPDKPAPPATKATK